MQIFIEAIDYNIWKTIEIGPYVPTIVDESTSTNITTEKPREQSLTILMVIGEIITSYP